MKDPLPVDEIAAGLMLTTAFPTCAANLNLIPFCGGRDWHGSTLAHFKRISFYACRRHSLETVNFCINPVIPRLFTALREITIL